jgi:uncharacterized membrane protein YcaP (DUF421 family)
VLHDLFHLDISILEKAVRTVVVYAALLVLLRLAGKRALAQLTAFDLVVLLLLSNVVQNAIIGPDNSLLGGLLGAAILLGANFALVTLSARWPGLQGKQRDLVRDGEVDETALKREMLTRSELDVALRRLGYDGIEGVRNATLEPEGVLVAEPREDPTLSRIEERLGRIESALEQR